MTEYLDSCLHVKVERGGGVGSPTAPQEPVQLVHILQLGVAVEKQSGVGSWRLTLQAHQSINQSINQSVCVSCF